MTHDQRIFEPLETINKAPGLTAGQLLARCTSVTAKTFPSAIKDMHVRGLIVTTGLKDKTEYHLTDSGRASLECGELPAPQTTCKPGFCKPLKPVSLSPVATERGN